MLQLLWWTPGCVNRNFQDELRLFIRQWIDELTCRCAGRCNALVSNELLRFVMDQTQSREKVFAGRQEWKPCHLQTSASSLDDFRSKGAFAIVQHDDRLLKSALFASMTPTLLTQELIQQRLHFRFGRRTGKRDDGCDLVKREARLA